MKYQPQFLKLFNSVSLKALAAFFMVIDHIGMLFFPHELTYRIIGRLSMPIWCFFIAQGAKHTKNPFKYALRLLIFALISEPIFDFAHTGSFWDPASQSIMVTLLLGLCACVFVSWMHKGEMPFEKLPDAIARGKITPALCFILVGAAVGLSLVTKSEYGVYAVLSILVFYLFGDNLFGVLAGCLLPNLLYWYGAQNTHQWVAAFAFLALLFYNGEKGEAPRYFFYAYYPVHLLLLSMIALVL